MACCGWPPIGLTKVRDLGLALLLVLERELQLGAVGDRPGLVQVNVLFGYFSHPLTAEGRGRSPDRLRSGILPGRAARPDNLGHPVHAHDALLPAAVRPEPGTFPRQRPGPLRRRAVGPGLALPHPG